MRERLAALKARFEALVAEFGTVALAIYFGLFAAVLLAFWTAFNFGFQVGTASAAEVGTFGAAYVATRLTQPFRIVLTLVLTPPVARLVRRRSEPPA